MSSEKISEFNKDSLRRIAKEIVIRRYALFLHSIIYLLVNLLLFVINLFVSSYLWFLWPLTGWAILLLIHLLTYTIFRKGIVYSGTIGILYHVSAYVVINAFLVFVGFFTSDPQWTYANWVIWPIFLWGLILIGHLIIYFYVVPRRSENVGKGWIDRKVDKELLNLQEKTEKHEESKKSE